MIQGISRKRSQDPKYGQLRSALAREVKSVIDSRQLTKRKFSREYHGRFNLSANTVEDYITSICAGVPIGYPIGHGAVRTYQTYPLSEGEIKRLPLLLDILGISEDHPLIDLADTIFPGFKSDYKSRHHNA